MKKIVYIFYAICLLFSSCYKDNSNTEVEKINPIIIDFNTERPKTDYSVFMFDTLRIDPIIYKEGVPDANLTYEWYLSGNTIVPYVMDSTMSLCAYVSAPAQAVAYDLRLTVTDDRGIKKVMKFSITVLSPLSEGLIVADTKDGIHSDLSLLIDRCFNNSIERKDSKIYRDAYSDVNKEMIPGLVRDLQTASYGVNRSLTILTDKKSIIRGDYYDFVKNQKESDKGMFLIPPEELDATFIVRDNYYKDEHMCVNGLLYSRGTQNNNRFYNFYRYPAGSPDYFISKAYCPDASGKASFAFDEKNGKMLFFVGNNMFYGKEQITTGELFDVNNLKDYECLHLGQIDSKKMVMLSRQKSSGKYLGLVMKDGGTTPLDNYASSVFDFSAATDIALAKYYDLNVVEETVYYATDTKLYSTPIANIKSMVQYEAKAGEKITGITIWKSLGMIRYEDLNPESETGFREMSTKNRMMLVSIYNESTNEGKLVAIPIVTIGAGMLEQNPSFHLEFKGFGRILKIAKQEK